ncbi:MAG: hypothetical protein HGA76_04025 [Candidatus Firestonebacteria bacterium]|nr:hypothetical protein [Candidatus Firestonebacteria bacterium]
MKRWAAAVCVAGLGLSGMAWAEPISFEQAANVTGLAGIEVGADVDYAYTKVEKEGLPKTEQAFMDVPVFVRVGLPVLEAKVTVPYGTAKSTVQDNLGKNSQDQNYSGLKNVGLMVKTALTLPVVSLGAGVDANFPTGDPKKYLGEGLDIQPFVAAGIDAMVLKIYANAGFQYRGDYTFSVTGFDAGGNPIVDQGVKLKPGNDVRYAVGLEIPAGDVLSLHAELLGDKYGNAALDGNVIDNTAGSTLKLVPGIRLHAGPFKAKIAYEIPLEKKDDRPQYAPAADWRILAGVSLQFSL